MGTAAVNNIKMDQLEVFESGLKDALETIEETLAKKNHTHEELIDALRTVEIAFATGKGKKELLEYLELGEAVLTRDSIERILKHPSMKELAEHNRDLVTNVLRGTAEDDAEKLKKALKKIKEKKDGLAKPKEKLDFNEVMDMIKPLEEYQKLDGIIAELKQAREKADDTLRSQIDKIVGGRKLGYLLEGAKYIGAIVNSIYNNFIPQPKTAEDLIQAIKNTYVSLQSVVSEAKAERAEEEKILKSVEKTIKDLEGKEKSNKSIYKAQIALMRIWAKGGELRGQDAITYEGWTTEHFKTVLDALGEPSSILPPPIASVPASQPLPHPAAPAAGPAIPPATPTAGPTAEEIQKAKQDKEAAEAAEAAERAKAEEQAKREEEDEIKRNKGVKPNDKAETKEEKEKIDKELETVLKDYPELIKVISGSAKTNPEYPRLFLTAFKIREGKLTTDLDEKTVKEIGAAVTTILGLSKTPGSDLLIQKKLSKLIKTHNDALKAHTEKDLPAVIGEMKAILKVVSRGNAELKGNVLKVFNFIESGLSKNASDDDRFEFNMLKTMAMDVIFDTIPGIYDIKTGSNPEKTKLMREIKLDRLKEKSDEIAKTIKVVADSIADFEAEKKDILTPPSSKGGDSGTPPASASTSSGPSMSSESGSPSASSDKTTGTPGSTAKATGTPDTSKTAGKKETPAELEAEGSLNDKISALMSEVLSDKTAYSSSDPASQAIYRMITGKDKSGKDITGENGLPALKGFLLKPKLTLTADIEVLTKQSATELKSLLRENSKKKEDILAKIKYEELSLQGRMVEQSERTIIKNQLATYQGELNKLKDEEERIKTAMEFKNGTMRYDSTMQLLGMINTYIATEINKERPSQIDIMQRVESQIAQEKKRMAGKIGKIGNAIFGVLTLGTVLKPDLPATLKLLAKDEALSKIGPEKLERLAKFYDNFGSVKAWVDGIEGTDEQKMTKTVPRIIAYLEMALRDGNMRYLRAVSAGRAQDLVNHLKKLRHIYIANKVKEKAGDSDIDNMNAYLRELNMATVSQNEITTSILGWSAVKRAAIGAMVLGTAGVGGAFYGGITAALSANAGWVALGGTGAVGAGAGYASLKVKDPENKKAFRRGVVRALGATGLGVGATLLGASAIPMSLMAIPGLFSYEFFKNRKVIGQKTAAAGKFVAPKAMSVAKFALLFAATFGAYGVYKVGQKLSGPSLTT